MTDAKIQQETKAVRLDLSPEEHKALRVVAAKAGLSMSAYVKSLVLKQLETKKEKAR